VSHGGVVFNKKNNTSQQKTLHKKNNIAQHCTSFLKFNNIETINAFFSETPKKDEQKCMFLGVHNFAMFSRIVDIDFSSTSVNAKIQSC
jgi:hypothetical protein